MGWVVDWVVEVESTVMIRRVERELRVVVVTGTVITRRLDVGCGERLVVVVAVFVVIVAEAGTVITRRLDVGCGERVVVVVAVFVVIVAEAVVLVVTRVAAMVVVVVYVAVVTV